MGSKTISFVSYHGYHDWGNMEFKEFRFLLKKKILLNFYIRDFALNNCHTWKHSTPKRPVIGNKAYDNLLFILCCACIYARLNPIPGQAWRCQTRNKERDSFEFALVIIQWQC